MFGNITIFYQQFALFFQSPEGIQALLGIVIFLVAVLLIFFRLTHRTFRSFLSLFLGKKLAMKISFVTVMLLSAAIAYQGYTIFEINIAKTKYLAFVSFFMLAIIKTILLFVLFYILAKLARPLVNKIDDKSEFVTPTLANWATKIIQAFLWIIFLVSALEINGISIAPALAGLGVVGVAIALSAQDLVKSLIAGMIIVLEGNLASGDYVILENGIEGQIQRIGIRTTSMIAKDKSLINVSNYELAYMSITNITRRAIRRLDWTFGLEYSTTPKQLKKIIAKVKDYVHKSEDFTDPDDALQKVNIDEFAASSININVICFYASNNFSFKCDAKERLLEKTREIVEKEGASFAFPSRTIYKGK